jgi:hypothetical protein
MGRVVSSIELVRDVGVRGEEGVVDVVEVVIVVGVVVWRLEEVLDGLRLGLGLGLVAGCEVCRWWWREGFVE